MLSSMTPLSSGMSVDGFKNGGFENMLSKCAHALLLTSGISTFCSALSALKPLIIPPKIPRAVPCDRGN